MDLNHSVYVFGLFVLQYPIDRCSAIPDNENVMAWQRYALVNIAQSQEETLCLAECSQADYIEGDTSWENVSSGHIRIAGTQLTLFIAHITKTCLYNFDPLNPTFI